jgi:hypothetical protein
LSPWLQVNELFVSHLHLRTSAVDSACQRLASSATPLVRTDEGIAVTTIDRDQQGENRCY